MLVKNPLTSFLYTCGYNGIENIYEYWDENKDNVLAKYFHLRTKRSKQDDLTSFAYKIRWGSPFAVFLRLGIDKAIRTIQNTELGLKDVKVRYGKKYLSINDFTNQTMSHNMSPYNTDLRGISILKKTFNGVTIRNVDFSYATLDANVFNSVTFVNCRFLKTSFRDARLINCQFTENCILKDNDFTQAFINSDFNCDIESPKVNYKKMITFKSSSKHAEQRYLSYTVVVNSSFNNQWQGNSLRES